jgi:hypothetical protein
VIDRHGVLGVPWLVIALLAVLAGVDLKYNGGATIDGIRGLVASIIPHKSVTVGGK